MNLMALAVQMISLRISRASELDHLLYGVRDLETIFIGSDHRYPPKTLKNAVLTRDRESKVLPSR